MSLPHIITTVTTKGHMCTSLLEIQKADMLGTKLLANTVYHKLTCLSIR